MKSNGNGYILSTICGAIVGGLIMKLFGFTILIIVILSVIVAWISLWWMSR